MAMGTAAGAENYMRIMIKNKKGHEHPELTAWKEGLQGCARPDGNGGWLFPFVGKWLSGSELRVHIGIAVALLGAKTQIRQLLGSTLFLVDCRPWATQLCLPCQPRRLCIIANATHASPCYSLWHMCKAKPAL